MRPAGASCEARGPVFIGLFFSYFITDLLIGGQLPAEMRGRAFDRFVDIYMHGILAGE